MAGLCSLGAATPTPGPMQRSQNHKVLTLKASGLMTFYLVLFYHLMTNTFPGCLEMIDGPCKYGHYHKGTSHLHPHYSLSSGDIRSPNFIHMLRACGEKCKYHPQKRNSLA